MNMKTILISIFFHFHLFGVHGSVITESVWRFWGVLRPSFPQYVCHLNDRKLEITLLKDILKDDGSKFFVWKIKNGNAILVTDITNYTALETNATYVVLQILEDRDWNLHYWIGGHASETDADNAANYAKLIDNVVHTSTKIDKEAAGMESSTFKAIFGRQ